MASLCSCVCNSARSLSRATLRPWASTSARLIQTSSRILAFQRSIPHPRDDINTPADFLKRIGRSMEQHESKLGEDWESLWKKDTERLKAAGITAPKERKYILRQMNYYRRGRPIREIKAKPPKKFRGRGPKVQKGVRVR
ncbi:hypothetical protein P389DRAFT_174601 [Cystobasidium minutum MCA 4210]|uniref:mitochondrial 37S ribosomal protein mS41 n=1 Tax=Cystobasidium minutum MCA 4210 TaxID=1397322 RepID=UPI0034CDD8D9|eukprot:jgi/Rhomi1/174601/fgenesh1_kg.8_\